MKLLILVLLLILGIGCSDNHQIILWDYENKTEIEKYIIIDSDSIIQSNRLLTKANLDKIDRYKYFVINSEGYYSEDLNMFKYVKGKIDTIYFRNRSENKNKPPKYETSIRDMKYKELSNKSFINRENRIKELKICLEPLKEKFDEKILLLSMTIHKNGEILEYQMYKSIKDKIPINKNEGKDCFKNLGELIYGATARFGNNPLKTTLLI